MMRNIEFSTPLDKSINTLYQLGSTIWKKAHMFLIVYLLVPNGFNTSIIIIYTRGNK